MSNQDNSSTPRKNSANEGPLPSSPQSTKDSSSLTNSQIPYNRPPIVGKELEYLQRALSQRKLCGDGPFTKLCHQWLVEQLQAQKALLTHSCTAALEMSALLVNLSPGDEVIMPSFTFVSTANAVVLRGATPVFVDVRSDTLNIDESLIEQAITPKTKAIFVVHYAGVSCAMEAILEIANKHNIFVLEDAAQGIMATYKGRALGTIGHLGSLSFHETKNIVAGEGGALLINDPQFNERAEIIREKGTNRSQFLRGEIDKYTWVDVGSSYLPSELIAAVLYAQLESASDITKQRLTLWNTYLSGLLDLQAKEKISLPHIPAECEHNGHIFYLLTRTEEERSELIPFLKNRGIHSVFHYVPLHLAPAGRRYARSMNSLPVTSSSSDRLLRLPLYVGMSSDECQRVVESIFDFYNER